MSTVITQTIQVLQRIVQNVPLGTNLALLQLMWSILNGSFLASRGAIYSALQANGLDSQECNRTWSALRYGKWHIADLIASWRGHVLAEERWQRRCYKEYYAVAVDWTTIWRPKLKGWLGKFYHGVIGRAVKGVGFGIVVDVGQVDQMRVPLLRKILRPSQKDGSDKKLKLDTLMWVRHHLTQKGVAIVDAGVKISHLQEAKVPRFVVRLANNCTGRRNKPPEAKGRGRPPEYGIKVRPLPRTYKQNEIPATEPDTVTQFLCDGRLIKVHGWQGLVLPTCKASEQNETFDIWVFFDPLYHNPLVLGTNLIEVTSATIFFLYLDRWPVEQVPLVAKQMLGLHRQFVFSSESCYRLPELAFLMGNVLSYLAAVLPPIPTGFWDKRPKKTSGRLRRLLSQADFPKDTLSNPQVRKKRSVTTHLPKGIKAHRRQKASS